MRKEITFFLILLCQCMCITFAQNIDNDKPTEKEKTEQHINNNDGLEHFRKGQEKLKEGDYAVARAYFTIAIEANSKLFESYVGRAETQAALNDHEEAIKDYDKALIINSNVAETYNGRVVS